MSFFRVLNNLFRFNRTNWKAVSLCFLAAAVFWLFNALNKEHTTSIRFPLQFEFDHQRFIASKALPHDVHLNVSGNGWDLLRRSAGLKTPALIITLEHPVEIHKIVGTTLPSVLASQLGSLKLNHVVTDTLFVAFEPRDSIRMKVFVDATQITFKEGLGRTSPIVVLPDSVRLSGASGYLPHARDSLIVKLPSTRLGSNYRESIDIPVKSNNIVHSSPVFVDIMFEVGEVEVVPRNFKIRAINTTRHGRHIQSDSVNSQIQIPKGRQHDFIEAVSSAVAEINLKGLHSGEHSVLPQLKGLPPYAVVISLDSVHVRIVQ